MAHADPFLEEMIRISGDLDRLIADRSAGPHSQLQSSDHIDRAGTLAVRMHQAGRGPGRPVNPPLGRHGTGYVW